MAKLEPCTALGSPAHSFPHLSILHQSCGGAKGHSYQHICLSAPPCTQALALTYSPTPSHLPLPYAGVPALCDRLQDAMQVPFRVNPMFLPHVRLEDFVAEVKLNRDVSHGKYCGVAWVGWAACVVSILWVVSFLV